MTINIRFATASDIGELCRLLEMLFMQETEFSPDYTRQRQALQKIISRPDIGEILVADDVGAVKGMINLLYTVSTALGGAVAVFEDMVVAPDARGRGIGTALLKAAIERANEKGCRRATLLADPDNESAHRFYRRHGFERSSMVGFRLLL